MHHTPHRMPRIRRTALALVLATALATGYTTSSTAATQTHATPAHATSKGPGIPGVGDPPIYWSTIRTTIAHALHRTPRQLASLWGGGAPSGSKGSVAPSSEPIGTYATQHGMTIAQLHALELQAVQQACNALVHQHHMTHTAASKRLRVIRAWSQSNLDGYSMFAYQSPQFP